MKDILDDLGERGFIADCSDSVILAERLKQGPLTVYAGFDPTAQSLQLGNVVPLMALARMQRAGHKVLIVIGGATGMVGDPSGKSEERNLLTPEDVAENIRYVKEQFALFLELGGDNAALILDNNQWTAQMTFIDWLRDVGKYFTINYMLAKESVKSRKESEQGLSYTEFSYMTMQAYDFLYLFDNFDCSLQVGGSDQWGNITAGIDFVRKRRAKKVFGLTFPLVTTSAGEKFGKTAGNSIWLDPLKTSPYEFYQYWINIDDTDVEPFLKYFTFLALDDISAICEAHCAEPGRREGQKRLAGEMTRLVHGEDGLEKALSASKILFGGSISGMTDKELSEIFADVPSSVLSRADLDKGILVLDLLSGSGVLSSKGEARRLIKGGGLNINNHRVEDETRLITKADLAGETTMVIRTGKKNYHLFKFE